MQPPQHTHAWRKLGTRLAAAVAGIATILAVVVSSAFAAGDQPQGAAHRGVRPKPISPAAVFGLPPTTNCLTASRLTIHVSKLRHVNWTGGSIRINGTRLKALTRPQLARALQLTGLPRGRFVLSITLKASDGRSVTVTRTYRSCAAKQTHPPVTTKPRPVATTPAPVATTPAPVVTAPQPGSYSGAILNSPYYYPVSLYVSAAGTHVQDITVPSTALSCSPGGTLDDHLALGAASIAPDGSFSAAATQTGVINHSLARFTYTFAGQFSGTNLVGSLREDINYTNGTAYSCTTGAQTWSAKRETQGSQTAATPAAGSYSGEIEGGPLYYPVSFYVSADGTHLQDVNVSTSLGCDPGGSLADHVGIGEIPISADGSFSTTTTQSGVIDHSTAVFTYTFSGHFHGPTSAGVARVAGIVREDIRYDNGTSFSCTTDNQAWAATRDTQGAQTAMAPPAGNYAGEINDNPYYYPVTLSVSGDSEQLLNVSLPTSLGCIPGGNLDDHITISAIPVAAGGSFDYTASQSGVIGSSPATITYTFTGHFHGPTSAGVTRVAGTLREDVTYNSGSALTCSTNDQPWSATHS